ncbi:MAG: FG-GAP-like repeat-containing protein [Candidatus Sulfotelmatobacter sp.]
MLRRKALELLFAILAGAQLAQAGVFAQAPQYPVGTNPQAVAVGDFNGDGNQDVAVVNFASNTVTILLGNGSGSFTPAPNCTATSVNCVTGSAPKGIATGDFNGDGYLDLAVTNSGSNTVSVLLGNGDGTFQPKVDFPTGTAPWGIAVGQFQGNGIPDIVVTNSADGTVRVLLFQGTKTSWQYSEEFTYNTGFNPSSIAVGDVNNDGIPDLVVANDNNNNVISVLLGLGTAGVGNGQFHTQYQDSTGNTPVSIALADFNGDGNLDIVTADQQGNTISILLGNGTGIFPKHVEYPTGLFPTSVAAGDFNGDGNTDVAVSDGDGNTVTVLWGVGDGTFHGQDNVGTGNLPYSVAAGNFTGSSTPDLVAANNGSNSVSIILSNGNTGTFQARTDYPAGTDPYSIVTADFNGDGNLDLAIGNYSAGTISIEFGNGDGTFQPPTPSTTYSAGTPRALAVADFNGDGIPDLAVADFGSGSVSILLGQHGGTFLPATTVAAGNGPASIVVGDFNGDGFQDLAVANFNTNNVSVLLGDGSGGFSQAPGSPISVGTGPVSLAVADLRGNGKLDLVTVNESNDTISVLLGNGDGTFNAQSNIGIGSNPQWIVAGNFSGNNIPDLAVVFYQSEEISVFVGDGNGTFKAGVKYAVDTYPSSMVVADFNGDGKLDLAMTGAPSVNFPSNVVSLLLGNGDGTFGSLTTPFAIFGVGDLPYSAAVGDFNGDGAKDLAVANSGSNTVSVLLNTQGTNMSTVSSGNPSSFGQSITFTTTIAASVPSGAAPSGTVTLSTGSSVLGSGDLVNGAFAFSTSALPVGVDSISAVYSGHSNYQPHTISLTQTVQQAATITSLLSSADPSQPNQSVTFTAKVLPGTSGLPTGRVTFMDGTAIIGSSTVNASGQAAVTIGGLSTDTHSITAGYSGDGNFKASHSTVLNQVVGQASTTIELTASPSSPDLNQTVILTATVASEVPAAPTGSVTFLDGSTQLGTATLNGSGIATFSTSALTAGAHNITAAYGGGGNYLASTSALLTLAVAAPRFTLLPSPSALSVAPGASATSTIKISPSGGLNPSQVTLTCSVAPVTAPAPTCSVGSITIANNAGSSTLAVTTTGSQAKLDSPLDSKGLFALGLIIPALLLSGSGFKKASARRLFSFGLIFLVLGVSILEVACSSAGQASSTSTSTRTGSSGTPAGTYTITVTGTSNEVQTQTATISLTVQ